MAKRGPIRVLLVDDSPTFRAALALALASDPDITVVAQAADGVEALALVERLQPDVVTMDVVMPKLDGLEASKRILASSRPIPIILMSTLARSEEQRMALNALRLGVVDVINKPVLAGEGARAGIAQAIRLVKAAADVQVTHRDRSGPFPKAPVADRGPRRIELIAVAASTGGPPALAEVLGVLPTVFPPVVVAQHLAASFTAGFADWLGNAIKKYVVPVAFADKLKPSTVYVAAESSHVRVRDGCVEPVPVGRTVLSPNADVLFHSVAEAYGKSALGIVLSGMGNDGAVGLRAMKEVGAWTIGQDAESSLVYGMPRVAFEAGACCEQLALDLIGPRVLQLIGQSAGRGSA
jgi:two-component system, chemotaxis family, protein-glutamate methylesterase/glutaminase